MNLLVDEIVFDEKSTIRFIQKDTFLVFEGRQSEGLLETVSMFLKTLISTLIRNPFMKNFFS